MKKFFILIAAAILLTIQFSCSRSSGSDSPNNPDGTTITMNDLAGYYFALETTNDYRTIYFVNENNTIKAYYDYRGGRRIYDSASMNITNNVLKITSSTDGFAFTFNLAKDASGNITLSSTESSGATLSHTEIYKNSDAPVFLNPNNTNTIFTYNRTDGVSVYLYFNNAAPTNPAWKWDGSGNFGGMTSYYPIYYLGNKIGFKSNDEKSFGVFVKSWKGSNQSTLLMVTTEPKLEPGKHLVIKF